MAALGLIVSLGVLGIGAFALWASLQWVLGPLDRAAKNRQFPIQFGLADLLCLFVLVQLPVGIVHWVARSSEGQIVESGVVTLDCAFVVAAVVVWWNCVRTLSRAGIHVVWRRCIVLTVALPGAIVGSVAATCLPVASVAAMLEGHFSDADGWLLLAEIPVLGILYGLGRFTRAIVASSKTVEELSRDGAAPEEYVI